MILIIVIFLSRLQEIAQAMQGVDILVTSVYPYPRANVSAESFFSRLISENLLTKCKAVIVRMVFGEYAPKPSTQEEVLNMLELDSSNLQEKLCKYTSTCYLWKQVYI